MCHYITSIIPDSVNLENFQKKLATYHLGFDEIMNPYIKDQIPNHYRYFRPTTGLCDCGTELGRLNYYKKEPHDSTKTIVTKLEKKGWSEAKINRWIAERDKNQSKYDRKFEYLHDSTSTEIEFWNNFLYNLLSSNVTNEFGLLLHWYDKSLESNFKLKSISKIRLDEVSNSIFNEMKEDILYIFSK